MKRKYTVNIFDPNAWDAVLNRVDSYSKGHEELTGLVANAIRTEAQARFGTSYIDDIVYGTHEGHYADVDVYVEHNGTEAKVIADGKDAVWAEFGAGVYHNGEGSPHRDGAELGFTMGSYGLGQGKNKAWSYEDETGFNITHGTPATMPLIKSVDEVLGNELEHLAWEAYGW